MKKLIIPIFIIALAVWYFFMKKKDETAEAITDTPLVSGVFTTTTGTTSSGTTSSGSTSGTSGTNPTPPPPVTTTGTSQKPEGPAPFSAKQPSKSAFK